MNVSSVDLIHLKGSLHLGLFLRPPTRRVIRTPLAVHILTALKLGDWLEIYAQALEINVWTSAEVQKVNWCDENKVWTVTVVRQDTGETRVLKPKHVVFALGVGSGHPTMPSIPGMVTPSVPFTWHLS